MAPTYDTLGEKYSSHKDKIVIAKMDATTNDIPPSAGFQVQSFPTIKFKPAGSKEWVDFAGDRSLEGFVDFISVNAKNKVPVNLEQLDNETNKGGPHDEVSRRVFFLRSALGTKSLIPCFFFPFPSSQL